MNAREDWLQARKAGIGGSDVAAMLGLSPYKTPLQLWMDKTGRSVETPDPDAAERMHWGTTLEDVVARHYARLHGVKIQRINTMLKHKDCPVAMANIDRAVVIPGSRARWDDESGKVLGASRILEVKTAHALARNSAEWGNPGTDEVPQAYWLQVQWYLGITGLEFADLAVLFGGQKYAEYIIDADKALFGDLLDEANGWWQRHVVADTPPEPSTEDDARRLWRSHIAGREKIVSADVADAVQQLAEIKENIKALEAEEQAQRDIICTAFGEAESISYMGQKLATWKANKASRKTDWKAVADEVGKSIDPEIYALVRDAHTTETEGSRVLRLSKIKE